MAGALGELEGFAKGAVGIPASVSRIRSWIAQFRHFTFERVRNAVDHERAAVLDLVLEIGFKKWASFWHYGRTLIDLQMRLFFEQVFSDLGEPWSKLVTGFGLVKDWRGPKAVTTSERIRQKRRSVGTKRTSKRRKPYDPATFGGH